MPTYLVKVMLYHRPRQVSCWEPCSDRAEWNIQSRYPKGHIVDICREPTKLEEHVKGRHVKEDGHAA